MTGLAKYPGWRIVTLVLLLIGASWATFSFGAKDQASIKGISPQRVADYLHAIIEADRTIYTTHVVNRMQEHEVVVAAENWEQEKALPLPAQFLQYAGRLVAKKEKGIRYRLISLWPIYRRNGPATDFERQGLEAVMAHPERPFSGIVKSGTQQYFQAIYPDKAVAKACVTCHSRHPLSPKRDFKLGDVLGGIVITIPLDS